MFFCPYVLMSWPPRITRMWQNKFDNSIIRDYNRDNREGCEIFMSLCPYVLMSWPPRMALAEVRLNPTPDPSPLGKGRGGCQAVIVHCALTPNPTPDPSPLRKGRGSCQAVFVLCALRIALCALPPNPTPDPSPLGKGRGGCQEVFVHYELWIMNYELKKVSLLSAL